MMVPLCTACAHEWEASQPISEPALKKCPKCKKNTAKRQVSGGTGFVLKGGGWYADLYSSTGGSKKPSEKSESESSSSTDASSSKAESGSKVASKEGKKESKKPEASKPSPSKASAD